MIKKIIKSLKANLEVTDFKVVETKNMGHQAYYVLGKLETTRVVDTLEYQVTVYHEMEEEGKRFIGQSSFSLSHEVSKKELEKKIDEALFSAKFVKNPIYSLPSLEKKKAFKGSEFEESPFEIINKISEIFSNMSSEQLKFNALEVFLDTYCVHIINSKGLNLTKNYSKIFLEEVPSFDGEDKVEIYRAHTYSKVDYDQIATDAKQDLEDALARGKALKIKLPDEMDVLIKGSDLTQFFLKTIELSSYNSVYSHVAKTKIGEAIQEKPQGDLITLSKIVGSSKDSFDNDGVIQNKHVIIDNGILVNYYGGNQFASYLGIEPKGNTETIFVEKGSFSNEKLMKKPHLEILALSGIQIDVYSDYIGGEVRLAIYNDGKEKKPVSGFSFSGSFSECLNLLQLSKEKIAHEGYVGPKYGMLKNMHIM